MADDPAHIALTNDIAGVGRDLLVVCRDLLLLGVAGCQCACNAAHIVPAQHIAAGLGGAVIDDAVLAIAQDTADVVAAQQLVFFVLCIGGAAPGPAGAVV